jgi:TRAP-type C4-dicarboxylate transport system permease small subunit
MTVRGRKVLVWTSAVLLLIASGWALNIATYDWYGADFHNEYSHAYASQGNRFFILAVALFGAFAWMVVAIIRSSRKHKSNTD